MVCMFTRDNYSLSLSLSLSLMFALNLGLGDWPKSRTEMPRKTKIGT